jgi:hypothetical protein
VDLIVALQAVREHLDPLDLLVPLLWRIGRRLARRGLGVAEYEAIRRALTATLAAEMGVAFGAREQVVWRRFLGWTFAALVQAGRETGAAADQEPGSALA